MSLRSMSLALLLLAGVLSIGCKPTIDEGRYTCHFDKDCPSDWVCRDDSLCWKTPIPPGPTRGDLTPLGGARSANNSNLVLEDDGFDVSDRVCDSTGNVCVSGGIGR